MNIIIGDSGMENNQKWVNLSYMALAALIAFVLFVLATKLSVMMDFDGRVRSLDKILMGGSALLGLVIFLGLSKSSVANNFMNEVVAEYTKVTWPTQDETLKATIAVLIAVVIAGIALWIIDSLWVRILELII